MDVKEAVRRAKDYAAELFSAEGMTHLGLEEVEYDDARDQWRVTVGFSRAWDHGGVSAMLGGAATRRTYKVVTIAGDGTPLSVKNRETEGVG